MGVPDIAYALAWCGCASSVALYGRAAVGLLASAFRRGSRASPAALADCAAAGADMRGFAGVFTAELLLVTPSGAEVAGKGLARAVASLASSYSGWMALVLVLALCASAALAVVGERGQARAACRALRRSAAAGTAVALLIACACGS